MDNPGAYIPAPRELPPAPCGQWTIYLRICRPALNAVHYFTAESADGMDERDSSRMSEQLVAARIGHALRKYKERALTAADRPSEVTSLQEVRKSGGADSIDVWHPRVAGVAESLSANRRLGPPLTSGTRPNITLRHYFQLDWTHATTRILAS